MKKRMKTWGIVLLAGIAGVALTCVYLMASGQFMSYDAKETYYPQGSFQSIHADVARAQVTVLPAEGEPSIQVYIKAWLPGPIDLSERFAFTVEGERLTVKEVPFESTFLGIFPQPYEMTVTVYAPQAAYDSYTGGTP